MRKILFITGTRADFGKLKPLIRAVHDDPTLVEYVFATGMHLLAAHGETYLEIRKCDFSNLFLCFNQTAEQNRPELVLAETVSGLSKYVCEVRPQLIVIHGDRMEALAGAIVGNACGVPVAHIEGGELSGTIDEVVRHAVTKLSHMHFVANREAQNRVEQMGEDPRSIHQIGSPEVDVMLGSLPEIEKVKQRYSIPFDQYAIFCYHSVSDELADLPDKIGEVLMAMVESTHSYVVIQPNNDPGAEVIRRAISEMLMPDCWGRFRIYPSMRFEYYLSLLKHAQFVLGNSSSGIREAPVYGVPAINLGTRQRNRGDSPAVVHVDENENEILMAMAALPKAVKPNYPFGEGGSAEKFVAILRRCSWQAIPQKQFQEVRR